MPSAPDSAEPGRVRFSHTKLIVAAATVALLAGGTAVAASHSGPSPSPSPSQADRLRAIERTRLHALVDATRRQPGS